MLRPARREQNGDEGESHVDEVVDERRVGTQVQVEGESGGESGGCESEYRPAQVYALLPEMGRRGRIPRCHGGTRAGLSLVRHDTRVDGSKLGNHAPPRFVTAIGTHSGRRPLVPGRSLLIASRPKARSALEQGG